MPKIIELTWKESEEIERIIEAIRAIPGSAHSGAMEIGTSKLSWDHTKVRIELKED